MCTQRLLEERAGGLVAQAKKQAQLIDMLQQSQI